MTRPGPSIDFWLCSQMQIRTEDGIRVLRPNRLHEMLALLLRRANAAVPVGEIQRSMWPEAVENEQEPQIRPYISKIRKLLDGMDVKLENIGHRYQMTVDPMRVDILRFERLVAMAQEVGDVDKKLRLLMEALTSCPRSALLSDFTRTWAHEARVAHVSAWDKARLQRNESLLSEGRHGELVELSQREGIDLSADTRLVYGYLLALYRAGRAADAIAYFEALARHLNGRRSVPRALATLVERIRRGDPRIDPPGQPDTRVAPNMLPPPRGSPAGREAELAIMRAHASERSPDAVGVVGIYGPPGIGKTVLATAYAHRYAVCGIRAACCTQTWVRTGPVTVPAPEPFSRTFSMLSASHRIVFLPTTTPGWAGTARSPGGSAFWSFLTTSPGPPTWLTSCRRRPGPS